MLDPVWLVDNARGVMTLLHSAPRARLALKHTNQNPMPTDLQSINAYGEPQTPSSAAMKLRRPRGTSVKAVSSAAVNAVAKIHDILLPLDEEQRRRVLTAVNALLGDGAS